ncbi:MAG: radical SAM family heme chaperone HemW [Phycisphaeraceae bacterium]|nr:radical SAM family heme chaperone HemW [Phycisphaeraceae bacterium]
MQDHTELRVIRQRPSGTSRPFLGSSPPLESAAARSLYIHIPFCSHKCHYCDFYSIVDTRDRQSRFTKRLIRELRAIAPNAGGLPLRTLFIGGGTPSLLGLDHWEDLLETLRESFDLQEMRTGVGEFTVECNPDTATPELLGLLRCGYVNRVSMGAQSFHAAHLRTLERHHDPESVPRAIESARAAGIGRQSLDLIYAIPGQTLADLDRDLDSALALGTEHLSAYTLTYEPGTAMTARLSRGEFVRAEEDLEADMFEHVARRLSSAGLIRYEVSNFARPGGECRHNMAYWRQDQWLAAGPSASGHFAGHRWKNVPRLDEYLESDDAGFVAIVEHEPPDARRALGEWLMTGVRLAEGLDLDAGLARADEISPTIRADVCRVIERYASSSHLVRIGARIAPTEDGFLIVDRIARDLLRATDAG